MTTKVDPDESSVFPRSMTALCNVWPRLLCIVTASQVAKETCKDSVLSKVLRYTQQGWPESVEDCLQPFQRRQHELSVEAECLLWGIRVAGAEMVVNSPQHSLASLVECTAIPCSERNPYTSDGIFQLEK